MASGLYVVVPFYNEEKTIAQTLDRLAAQTDTDFTLLLVDNNSSDDGPARVDAWRARHPDLRVQVITERQKGTGAASDTGFRQAIAQGATLIARTDADCLPAFDWVARIKQAFAAGGVELLAGRVKPRTDETHLSRLDLWLIPCLLVFAEQYCRLTRRGKQYKHPYILLAGNNMAITPRMYVQAGGFPRSSLELECEDPHPLRARAHADEARHQARRRGGLQLGAAAQTLRLLENPALL